MDREVTTVINSLLANKKLADDLVDFLTNENQRLQEALHVIGYGPPHEGNPLDLLNQFVDLARATLKERK